MRTVLPVVAVAALAACSPQGIGHGAAPSPDSPAPAERPAADLSSCGGEAYAEAVGAFLVAGSAGPGEINIDDLPQPHRILKPGMAYTMEFNPERLSIEVDGTGRILSVRCG